MIVSRVEKHIIKPSHEYYKMLDEFCFMSKNLYNFANYQIRQSFIDKENSQYINYFKMDKLLKQEGMNFDYYNMPNSASAQQCLRTLDKNWKSFFTSIKDWGENKEKYTGRPKLPKYLKKDGRNLIVLTNITCRIKNNILIFPKSFNKFTLNTRVQSNLQQVRILPQYKHIIIEVVYNIEVPEIKLDNDRYFSIDVGLDNLLTITNNFGEIPIIINGKGLKSINKYYNKQLSHYRELAKRMNKLDFTNKIGKLTNKRNDKITNSIHKASRIVVDMAIEHNVSIIVIGNNKDWKRKSPMSKKVNQSFVGIPHQDLINKIIYKAENYGIKVILTEESYTSGTSFLDNELPKKSNYNKSRRKYRGLFISNEGIKINADVNGSLQIMKKVFPNVFDNGIEGVGLHPIVVNIN